MSKLPKENLSIRLEGNGSIQEIQFRFATIYNRQGVYLMMISPNIDCYDEVLDAVQPFVRKGKDAITTDEFATKISHKIAEINHAESMQNKYDDFYPIVIGQAKTLDCITELKRLNLISEPEAANIKKQYLRLMGTERLKDEITRSDYSSYFIDF